MGKPAKGPRTVRAAETAYDAMKKRWDADKKKFEQASEKADKHLPFRLWRLAKLLKAGAHYRALGYVYIKRHGEGASPNRLGVYQLPGPNGDKTLGRRLAKIYKTTTAKKADGSPARPHSPEHGAGYQFNHQNEDGDQAFITRAGFPYPHEAHHIIPEEAFGLAFNESQLQVLVRIPYDINHGENIILLPKEPRHSPIHRLVTHNGSHAVYSDMVSKDMKSQGQLLKKRQCETCDVEHPPPGSILVVFIDVQRKYWKQIVTWGKRRWKRSIEDAAKQTRARRAATARARESF